LPVVESKLFRLTYLCGLKSQKAYDLKKWIEWKKKSKEKQ